METIVKNFNTNSYNPEITNLSMMYCAVLLTPIFCISAIYIYYISGDDRPQWSEFEYFITDLTPHIPITIILPLIIYLQNPRLRRFIVQNIKPYKKWMFFKIWSIIFTWYLMITFMSQYIFAFYNCYHFLEIIIDTYLVI